MSYGRLEVIAGPMFSGKTTELLKRILWSKQLLKQGKIKNMLVLKPSFDNRYSETEIVSHDGLKTIACSIYEGPDNINQYDIVFIDEVQFFTEPYYKGDIIERVKSILREGNSVVACGLDMDWKGDPFEISGKLLAMADRIVKTTANCSITGKPATKTFKKSGNGGSVELGALDKYEPRCNEYWSYDFSGDCQ